MNWIKQLISAPNGDPSTMRIAVLLIVAAVLGNWIFLTVHTGQPQKIDWEQVGLVLGSLTAKAAQAKMEAKPEPPAAPPTP